MAGGIQHGQMERDLQKTVVSARVADGTADGGQHGIADTGLCQGVGYVSPGVRGVCGCFLYPDGSVCVFCLRVSQTVQAYQAENP